MISARHAYPHSMFLILTHSLPFSVQQQRAMSKFEVPWGHENVRENSSLFAAHVHAT